MFAREPLVRVASTFGESKLGARLAQLAQGWCKDVHKVRRYGGRQTILGVYAHTCASKCVRTLAHVYF
jgi:hypothetical protein